MDKDKEIEEIRKKSKDLEGEVEGRRRAYDVEALLRAQTQEKYGRCVGRSEEEDIDSVDDMVGCEITLSTYK